MIEFHLELHWMRYNRTLKNTAIKIVIKYTPNCKRNSYFGGESFATKVL